jgi:hypothetical protein
MTMAATEILISSILVPVMIACFTLPFIAPDYAKLRELPAVLLVMILGSREQRRRLALIMASRALRPVTGPRRSQNRRNHVPTRK